MYIYMHIYIYIFFFSLSLYICAYIYIYIYIYICIQSAQKQDEHNIYVINHENNVSSGLSPQWICGNSCAWAHDVRLNIAVTNEPNVLLYIYIYIYIYIQT